MNTLSPNDSSPRAIKLEDLVALNDEIAALVRAGVPLELGLEQVSHDLRGSLGQLAAALGSHMSQGESLSQAMESESSRLPKLYRSVVEAGLRAGRLPAALEAVTRYAQSLLEVHRRVTLACVYPLIVFVLAYAMFLVMLAEMIPRFEAFAEQGQEPQGFWLSGLTYLSETMSVWGPVIPVLLIGVIGFWLFLQKRTLMRTGRSMTLFRFIPWAQGIHRNQQLANFSDLLGLLTEQEVPLHTGILLAADSTGDRRMIQSSEEISLKLQSGDSLTEAMETAHAYPSYLRWLMQTGEQQRTLAESLTRAAGIYRSRALERLETLSLALPLIAVAVIGGGATLIYAFALFAPMIESLRNLAAP